MIADAVRDAERVERRLVLEARSSLEAIYRLSSHLNIEICPAGETVSGVAGGSVIGPLAKLYGQGMRLSCAPSLEETRSTSQMRHKDWPLSRPLAPEVVDVIQGQSLEVLLVSLRLEKSRLEQIADFHIHNLYCLNRYEQLLKLPIQDQNAAWESLLASSETIECTGVSSSAHCVSSPGGGSARKRLRDSDTRDAPAESDSHMTESGTKLSQPVLGASNSLFEKKSLRSQDISSARIAERSHIVRALVEQQATNVQQQCSDVMAHIRTAVLRLNHEDGQMRDPDQLFENINSRCASPEHESLTSPLSLETGSVMLLPEVWSIVGAPPPTARLQRLLAKKEAVALEYYQLMSGRLDEAIVLLAEAYTTFHCLTGNASYAETPDYRVWARDSVMGSHAVGSNDVQRLQDAAQRAKDELMQLQDRIEFVRDHVMPLWSQRRDILARKDCLKNMSADRLFNKKGNMAKVLLQEENLRKEVNKKLPKLCMRMLDLCEEWHVKFGPSSLQIEGHVVEHVLRAERSDITSQNPYRSTSARHNTPPPPHPPLLVSTMDGKENSPLAKAANVSAHCDRHRSVSKHPSSLPGSRRASPMPRRPLRSATPSPPPAARTLLKK
ncbi:Hypothetical protein, putative [Bodo saltans]|uniref:Uncharacterized protein n=1 Tax=Bodo saltans TaxID=75058 RepID=A0A0S4J1H6_BODSA|nr:Hypothetical protein, putative [Bodo saltans]|eukprot:CUG81598.1 Hypothetical protein, putative [Bodo saltans]